MLTMNTQITDNGQQQQQRSQPQQQVGKNKTTFFDKVEDFIQTMDRTERQWNRINNPHGAAREQTPSKDEGRQDLLERMRERQREAAELQAVEMAHRANELSTKEGQSPPAQQTRLDIFANSPLFQRYLASIKLGRYHGKPFTVKHLVNADQTNRDKLYLPNGQKRRTYYEILEENSRQSKEYRRQFEQDKSAVDQVRRESQKLFRSNVIRLRRLYDKIRTDRKALREFSDIIRDARGKQNDKVFWEKLSEHQHLYASKESVCAATGTNSRNASRPPTQSTAGTRK
jgi:hypothetical protein